MPSSNSQPDHVAMKGDYWLTTKGTMDVIAVATPLVKQALEKMAFGSDTTPFCVTDMGCADGGSSMALLREIAKTVRAREPDREIQIIYTDQPRNNYNALFQLLHGVDGSSLKSYRDEFERLYVHASGTSFYEQMVPDNSLDLGFSCTAMHWLRSKPTDISDHIHAVGARGDELAAIKRQAVVDWQSLLLRRAAELKEGGRLVLVNFCRDEQGRYLGNTGYVNMFDTFNRLWRELVTKGSITESEYRHTTFPQYYHSLEEYRQPFDADDGPVSRAGLVLEQAQSKIVQCPYRADFNRHGDAVKFARDYVPTLRSWSESTFFGALSTDRPTHEREQLVDEFYGAYQALVEREPTQHAMDYVHAYLTIAKRAP